MNLHNLDGNQGDRNRNRASPGEPGRKPGKIIPVTKAIRAAIAIAVFGVPLAAATAALLAYGAHRAYRRITGRP